MLTTCTLPTRQESSGALFTEPGEAVAKWYALCTRLGQEKRVACNLQAKAIPFYLPTYEKRSQRKPRQTLNAVLPLFPGYIFVRVPWIDRALVLEVPGAVSLLAVQRQALPQFVVETMRANLHRVHARPHPYLTTGVRVHIQSGPLCGLEGIVAQPGSRMRIVVTIEPLARSMVVVADGWDTQRIPPASAGQALAQ